MRKLHPAMLLILLIGPAFCLAQQGLRFEPAKPHPGDRIKITYNPSGTPMLGQTGFEAQAYLMEAAAPRVEEIALHKEGNEYIGWFNSSDTSKSVFVSFKKDEIRDNNNDEGYYVIFYQIDDQPVEGALLSVAKAINSYGYLWGLRRNVDLSRQLLNQVFEQEKNRKKYRAEYLSYLGGLKDDDGYQRLKNELENIAKDEAAPENDLSLAVYYYENKLKDAEKAKELGNMIRQKYPAGSFAMNEQFRAIYNEKDLGKKEELYAAFAAHFPPKSNQDSVTYSNLATNFVSAYGEKGDYAKMKWWASRVSNKMMLAQTFNSIAWKLSGEGIYGTPVDVKNGKEISELSLHLVDELKKSGEGRYSFYTKKEWDKNLDQTYAVFADTYALLLYHLKEFDKAYAYEKKAVEAYDRKYTDFNESFAVYTEKIKGSRAAIAELESFIREGKSTVKMKEQLKRLYLADNHELASWDKYVSSLEEVSRKKRQEELAKLMINEASPDFALRDMDGNEVSLASLKGKIVIVDFWATWCGPCKASFPGMKKAVEQYKNDPNVKFVFVDTWENGEKDKVKKQVADFISKNAYPFYVLMDYDNKVVEKFSVEGIPTKFVIDQNSRVRFRDVGFGGNTDELADEMAFMIEMIKGDKGKSPDKKGF